jgi:hypothetical protein
LKKLIIVLKSFLLFERNRNGKNENHGFVVGVEFSVALLYNFSAWVKATVSMAGFPYFS